MERFSFSAKSNLLIRQESEFEGPQGKVGLTVRLTEFLPIDGIKYAHSLKFKLRIAPGVVHRIVHVLGDAIFLPLRPFECIPDEAGVKIADPPAGKTERVSSQKTVEVVIDELPIEREIVGHEDRQALGMLVQSQGEHLHHRFGTSKPRCCSRENPLNASASGTNRSEIGRVWP